jgi:hypothetical protein
MLNDFSGTSEMLFKLLGTALKMPDKRLPGWGGAVRGSLSPG